MDLPSRTSAGWLDPAGVGIIVFPSPYPPTAAKPPPPGAPPAATACGARIHWMPAPARTRATSRWDAASGGFDAGAAPGVYGRRTW
jgi:hypothetical protein